MVLQYFKRNIIVCRCWIVLICVTLKVDDPSIVIISYRRIGLGPVSLFGAYKASGGKWRASKRLIKLDAIVRRSIDSEIVIRVQQGRGKSMSCIIIVGIADGLSERLSRIAERTDVFFTSVIELPRGEEGTRDRVDNAGCLRVTGTSIRDSGVRVTGSFDIKKGQTSARAVKECYATLISVESVANEHGTGFISRNGDSRRENACNGESSKDCHSRKHKSACS